MAQIEELYRKEAEAKFELECNEYNARFSIYKEKTPSFDGVLINNYYKTVIVTTPLL